MNSSIKTPAGYLRRVRGSISSKARMIASHGFVADALRRPFVVGLDDDRKRQSEHADVAAALHVVRNDHACAGRVDALGT
jgi:hypothetical protein